QFDLIEHQNIGCGFILINAKFSHEYFGFEFHRESIAFFMRIVYTCTILSERIAFMPTLRDLRLQARLSINALAHLARIDRKTVERAEEGQPVQDAKAYAIVETLGQELG